MDFPEVLYEDNHIIAINKMVGEIVQGDKTGDVPLSEKVKEYIKEKFNKPGAVFLGVIHRIDRPVSGIVLFARTSKALERMNKLFREKEIKTVGMNFLAFGGSIDARESKHKIRRLVNDWFAENSEICDCFVDVYTPTIGIDGDHVKKEYLGKDNLHPNTLGGEVIASLIPIDFFKE